MRERIAVLSPADSKAMVDIRWEPLYGMCVWERKEVDILRQKGVCREVRVWRRDQFCDRGGKSEARLEGA